MLVCGPHNPTGFLFAPEAWLEVVAIAREAGVWLFSDEVYRGLEHDPGDRLPQGGAEAFCERLVGDTGILLVPSSRFDYGDAHLRIGYGRRDLPEALDELEAYLARG